MRALWRLAAPVAFAAAGVLFATSAGVANGGQLRGTRSDLGDLIRAEQQRADDLTGRVERLRGRGRGRHRPGRCGRPPDRRRAAALPGPRAGRRDRAGHRPQRDGDPGRRARARPTGCSRRAPARTTSSCTSRTCRPWSTRCGPAAPRPCRSWTSGSSRPAPCAASGNTLILQGRVYSPPYEITAIGDPDRLYAVPRRRPAGRSSTATTSTPTGWSTRRAPRPGPPCPATTGRWSCVHARVRVRDPVPRSAASASCSSPRAWCCCCSSPTSWSGPTTRRTGRPTGSADDIRDDWSRPPGRTTGGPDTGTALPTSARASRSCTSRASASTGSVPVVEGVDLPDLARGVGHYPDTARPGQVGNFAVAGHRATNGEPFATWTGCAPATSSWPRPEAAGSPTSSTAPGSSTPTSTWVIDPVPGKPGATPTEPLLTLTTCNPRWASTERLIVFGHLEESRAKRGRPPRRARPGGRGGLMYAWIWRHLPGPWPVRSLLARAAGGGRRAAAVHDRVPLGRALPALPRRDGGPVTDRCAPAPTHPGRRQLRQLRLQPGAVPRPARRRVHRACATTRWRRPTRRGVRRRAAQPRARHPGEGRRLRRPGPRGRRRGAACSGSASGHQAIAVAYGGDRRTGPRAAARQDQRGLPRGRRRAGRAAVAVHRHPLPLARGARGQPAGRARGHRHGPRAAW